MGKLEDLEARLQILEDIEAIEKLKGKYWRSVDGKQWDKLSECFAEDLSFEAVVRLGTGPDVGRRYKVEGKKAVVDRISGHGKKWDTIHQGHTPDIKITSKSTARGIWTLHDIIVDLENNTLYSGRGFYDDEYTKVNGEWKISKIRIYRLHQRHISRSHTVDDLRRLVY